MQNFEINIKQLSITDLLQHHHPEEILGYCSRCENHGKFWSCPPHPFDTSEYLSLFKYATIIGIKIHLEHLDSSISSIEYYHQQKIQFNKQLLKLESSLSDAKALIAGHCWHCEKCTRTSDKPCNFDEICRYSLESLGIKISDIIKVEFKDELLWKKGETPNSLYAVLAILNQSQIDQNLIKDYLQKID